MNLFCELHGKFIRQSKEIIHITKVKLYWAVLYIRILLKYLKWKQSVTHRLFVHESQISVHTFTSIHLMFHWDWVEGIPFAWWEGLIYLRSQKELSMQCNGCWMQVWLFHCFMVRNICFRSCMVSWFLVYLLFFLPFLQCTFSSSFVVYPPNKVLLKKKQPQRQCLFWSISSSF